MKEHLQHLSAGTARILLGQVGGDPLLPACDVPCWAWGPRWTKEETEVRLNGLSEKVGRVIMDCTVFYGYMIYETKYIKIYQQIQYSTCQYIS